MDIITGILSESYNLLNQMSPYLLFGLFFAGILHMFLDAETVASHLGKSDFLSVVKASLFGIPLPLCSCGVIPAAMSLRKEGASKGAIVSFLISTPTTGIDSIFATYSLLGAVFACYRVLASFLAGVFAGVLENIFVGKTDGMPQKDKETVCKVCCVEGEHGHAAAHKFQSALRYAFGELVEDMGRWLLLGIFIGGVISFLMPASIIENYLGSGLKAMLVMLMVGIPMYVCATGSIPIAAALMMKGLDPGAVFVFLLAGPATNAVSMTVISRNMGKKTLFVYLLSIVLSGLILGGILDRVWGFFETKGISIAMAHRGLIPRHIEVICSAVLVGLIIFNIVRNSKIFRKKEH